MSISSSNIKPDSCLFQAALLLPSHLCIDAPLVAISWSTAIEFLRHGSIESPFPHIALFFAVWTIYLFDRLYDSRPGLPEQRESLRHQFAGQNRSLLFCMILIAIAICIFLLLSGLIHRVFLQWGIFLSVPVILYFILFRFSRTALNSSQIPMKEITIGLCFAAGTCLTSGAIHFARFIPLGILFTLNCLIISRSEAIEDARSDPAAFYSTNKKVAPPYLEFFAALITCTTVWFLENKFPYRVAVTFSTFLLLTIFYLKRSPRHTQALADAAMLTPWPVLWMVLQIG